MVQRPFKLHCKEKREYVNSLHSWGDDMSWSGDKDDFYKECVENISRLVNSIPEKEISEKEQLSPLVKKLIEAVNQQENEPRKELVRKRYDNIKIFRKKLDVVYPWEFELK